MRAAPVEEFVDVVAGVRFGCAVSPEPVDLARLSSMPVPAEVDRRRAQIAPGFDHRTEARIDPSERVLGKLLGQCVRAGEQVSKSNRRRVSVLEEPVEIALRSAFE